MTTSPTAPLSTLLTLPLDKLNARPLIDLVISQLPQVPRLTSQGTNICPYGYVICAGGRYAKYGYATCRWIREQLKDDAPIEVWVGSDEQIPTFWKEVVMGNVNFLRADIPGGWPLKARAVLKSSFERVILLDADCIPMVKATTLWQSPHLYSGALFFPDVANHRKSDWGYAALKLRAGSVPEMEAGQLAIDRVRHSQAVVLVDYFNQHPEFFYEQFHGDKDLWALAFARLGIAFTTGAPCTEYPWGLRHFLPDGTHYSDHLIHIKNGQSCPHPEYQGYLEEFENV